MLPSLHSALTKIDEASVEIASLQSNNPILPINSTLATLRPKSELRATFSRAAQTADATKILQVGEFLHCFTTLDEYDKQPQWYAKFVQLDSIKGYLSIYKDDPLLKTELRPDQKLYLHNAKMVDNGKKIVNGESDYYSFKITTIGKPFSGIGVEYKVSELAIKTRRQQKIWMRCIGKCVQAIANLNDIEYRIEKPSRHETHDWRSKRVIVHDNQSLGGSGDKFSRRRPTLENLDDAAIARANGQTPPTPHEYPKSISKHATDQKWTLSENNFYKTPARPRTQTTAPPIPDSLFGSVYKNDLDNILIFLEGHRQFDSLEGRAGDKLLHTACVSGQLSLVVFFTDKGAKVTGMDGYGESPLYCAVKGRHVKVVDFLMKKGAEVNDGNAELVTPLSLACANGDKTMVNLLLNYGGNPMTPDIRGITPFFTACAQGHKEVVKILLMMNEEIPGIVDIHKKTNNDITPIYATCQRGNLDIVMMLIEMGAKFDDPSIQGITPFHAAVERGELSICRHLVALGVDINTANHSSMSCVHTSVKFNKGEMLKYLVEELGLDINVLDSYGNRCLDLAKAGGEAFKGVEELVVGLGGVDGYPQK